MFPKIARYIFILSVLLFVFSHFQKTKLPPQSEITPLMFNEPTQENLEIEPFKVEKNGYIYSIEPKYNYEIYGLVVSEYDSENLLDIYHEKDPLNTKDICLVWGENLKSDVYRQVSFTHGEFTCYFKYSLDLRDRIFINKISNNHLLAKNNSIYNKIKESNTGDQVYAKGYLANYTIESKEGKEMGRRTTSTTRDDTGGGSCEVIYITEFGIVKKANVIFHYLNRLSQIIMGVSFLYLFINFAINTKRL